MSKYRAADILIDLYNSKSNDEKFEREFEKFLFALSELVPKFAPASISQDVVSDMIIEFLDIIRNRTSKIIEECSQKSVECGKRITSYIFSVMKSKISRNLDTLTSKENNRLRVVLREAIDELTAEGLLITTNSGIQKKSQNAYPIFYGSIPNVVFNITNKDGTINKSTLKKLIVNLFNDELEKYSVPISYLKDIVSEITGVGRQSRMYLDKETEDNEGGREFELSDENIMNDPGFLSEVNDLAKKWTLRVEERLNIEELKFLLTITILKFGYRFSLKRLSQKFGKPISTIDHNIKKFFKAAEITKELDGRDINATKYLEAFLLFISEKYRIDFERYLNE